MLERLRAGWFPSHRGAALVDAGRSVLEQRVAGPVVKIVAAFGGSYLLARFLFDAPIQILFFGSCLGALYGLIGASVILIYRTNRIINFAAAGLGAVPAVLAVLLIVLKGWSWYVAFPLATIGGALLGAAVDFCIIRRFASAPRLILTVATIGLSQLLAYFALLIPIWLGSEGKPISVIATPFRNMRLNLGNERFSGDYPFALLVVALVIGALTVFFKYTRIGIALRASAENADRASLLGIPVRRVGTVAWTLAGTMAAITIFLRSTLVGVPTDGSLGPTVLLYALASAVIARMESIPTALVAGMGIGVLAQASVFHTGSDTLAGAIMLCVILAALLVQKSKLSRGQDTGVSSFKTVKEFKAIPPELRRTPEIVAARGVVGVVIVGVALAAPYILGLAQVGLLTLIVIYAIVAVSLVVLTGWAGQISLGQFGIVGVAAATAGGLAANHNVDFFLTMFAGIGAGTLVAVLIGLPAVRVQGLFLAVTTLAFAQAVSGYVLNNVYPLGEALLPQSGNRINRPILWGRIDLSGERAYYYLCLTFLVIVLLAASAYRRNRAGRVLIAVRDNPRAAPSYSINLARSRLAAFAVSGALASIGGVLLGYQLGAIDRVTYGVGNSLEIFIIAVVGGLTSLPGAVLGAAVIQSIKYFGESHIDNLSLLVTGPGILAVLLFLPGGFAEALYSTRDLFLRWVAARRGIEVPSLIADRRLDDDEDHVIQAAEESSETTLALEPVGTQ
ncbi:MAG TPA: ABC transporter permease [Acidimicrobiales bacterium]|nr:ABC transporter permease [Acidimicrobiales bacterium]